MSFDLTTKNKKMSFIVIPKMLTSGVLEILTRLSVSGFAFFTLWSFNKFYWNRYMSDRVIYVRQSFIAFKEDKM